MFSQYLGFKWRASELEHETQSNIVIMLGPFNVSHMFSAALIPGLLYLYLFLTGLTIGSLSYCQRKANEGYVWQESDAHSLVLQTNMSKPGL